MFVQKLLLFSEKIFLLSILLVLILLLVADHHLQALGFHDTLSSPMSWCKIIKKNYNFIFE